MEFRDRLRQLRTVAGLTQKELAEKTGLATGTIQRYELGTRSPNYEALMKLANVFALEDITELYDAKNQVIDKRGNLITPTGSGSQGSDSRAEELIGNYNQLNDDGRDVLLNTSRGLVASGQYRREKQI